MYIHKFSSISSLDQTQLADLEMGKYMEDLLEPAYESLLDVRSMRRMSKILKMGIYTANDVLREVDTSAIDGIVSATGLGSTYDTIAFLQNMIAREEHLLTPTSFIQSTHNTLAGTLGIQLRNNCYNNTWSQRFLSFYAALEDIYIKMKNNSGQLYVLAAADEMPELVREIIGNFTDCVSNRGWDEVATTFVLSEKRLDASDLKISNIGLKSKTADFRAALEGHYIINANEFLPAGKAEINIDFRKIKPTNFVNDAVALALACQLLHSQKVTQPVTVLGGDESFITHLTVLHE